MLSTGKAAAARRAVAVSSAAILTLAMTLPPILAADVNITSNVTTGIDLNSLSGVSIDILTGVSVTHTNTVITGTNAWALTNSGTIDGTSIGSGAIKIDGAGSSVTNNGLIKAASTGISLIAGGTVTNALGATIESGNTAIRIGTAPSGPQQSVPGFGPGTVINSGAITQTGTASDLVLLYFGGIVTNNATGVITANSSGNAVSVGQGASREVWNAGTIINTRLTGNSTGVFFQGGASTLTNTVTGVIKGGFNGIYTSSSAPLTLNNAGIIESTGASASSKAVEASAGGTFINSGTIKSASGDGLYLGQAGTVTNSGTIQGAVNAIRFNGNYARTLNLATGSVLTGIVQGGTGVDNLVLLGTGTESAAKFLSFETLSMQGGAWTLSNAGTFSTSGEVQAGVLNLTGTITTPSFSVRSAGTLSGTGTVVGALSNAGTVDLTAGTLNVTGTFANASGSLFRVAVSSGGSAGLLDVTGAATLSGGSVGVVVASGAYAVGDSYKILEAASVTGTFAADVLDDSPFLSFVLDYGTAGEVWLRVTGITNLPEGADTPNQFAAATALQDLGDGDVFDAIGVLMSEEALEAFDEVSGEIHASVLTALASSARYPRDAALDRVGSGLTGDQAIEGARNVWSRVYGGRGTVEGDGNAADMDFGAGGILVGVDGLIAPDVFAGILAGVGGQGVDIPDRASTADIRSYHLGLYGGAAIGEVRLALGAAVSAHDVSVTRSPEFTGFSDELDSSYGVTTGQLFGELGYAFDLGEAELVTFIRAAFLGQSGGDYAEIGGDASLSGSSDASGAAVLTLGLKASTDIAVDEDRSLTAHGLIALQHTSGDAPTATHAFEGGTLFTVSGADPDETALLLEAGISGELAPGINLDLGYQGSFGSAGSAHGLKLTVSGAF
jgi:uncharacterized protein with beta-barrel porin domain